MGSSAHRSSGRLGWRQVVVVVGLTGALGAAGTRSPEQAAATRSPASARFAGDLAAVRAWRAAPTQSRSFAGRVPFAQYREFAANCSVSHRLSDDPIVFPRRPGATHNHTFVGNRTTNAFSTNASLVGGPTTCQDPADGAAYWFPTLLRDGVPFAPERVTIYYKSGVNDYRTVRPFPVGFRLLIGDPHTPAANAFRGNWSCGEVRFQDIPASCPAGSSLTIRYKAPSCWDGVHLDASDHRSHMAYPVNGRCPSGHPVALPMLEIKVPYKLPGGDTHGLTYSSGPSYSFHYDYMNGWKQSRLVALVHHCINGGRQCNGRGYDAHKP